MIAINMLVYLSQSDSVLLNHLCRSCYIYRMEHLWLRYAIAKPMIFHEV